MSARDDPRGARCVLHWARQGAVAAVTDRLQPRRVTSAVRETGWIRPAAARCGIPESVAREWIQRGKGEHPGRGATREYAAFAAGIARASEWEAPQLAVLDAAARRGLRTGVPRRGSSNGSIARADSAHEGAICPSRLRAVCPARLPTRRPSQTRSCGRRRPRAEVEHRVALRRKGWASTSRAAPRSARRARSSS
jgi:hypothetical protein